MKVDMVLLRRLAQEWLESRRDYGKNDCETATHLITVLAHLYDDPPEKPVFPRCTTCRHWAGSPEKTMRYACRKMENSQPVISCHLHGETRNFPVNSDVRMSITTKPDFGCVWHEPLEANP